MAQSRGDLRSLRGGLAILGALNRGGPLTLADLAHQLDMPRTTARRLLATLIAEGCCLRVPSSRLYALGAGVLRLASGYGAADRLAAACAEALPALSDAVGWPAALAVPDGLVMRVRLCTDFASPFALARMRPGYATPQADTTTGLLYLGSLDAADRDARLDAIYAATWRSPLRFARDEVERLIAQGRQDGYLALERRFPEASLGVPLAVQGRIEGGLVLRYVRSAVLRDAVSEHLLPRLQHAARAICAQVDQGAQSGAVTGS